MDPILIPSKKGPEGIIQDRIKKFLEDRDWLVLVTHGNAYQSGLPDLYCTNKKYGHRWIEVKYLDSFRFTKAQLEVFPQLCANGDGVWILVDATEKEYNKLFKPCNWFKYLIAPEGNHI